MWKKRVVILLLCLMVCVSLAGCSIGDKSSNGTSEPKEKVYLQADEIAALYTNPDNFKGKYLKLSGKVFAAPEKDDDGVYFQMFGDPKNGEQNTVIGYKDSALSVNIDDYVIVDGMVQGTFKGQNAFGGEVTAPIILADEVVVSSYEEVMSPAIASIVPENGTIDQHGCAITIDKIDFAADETRVHVTVNNNSSAKLSVYSFNIKIIQNGNQYEETRNYEANYPELQSDILPGATSSGVVALGAVDPEVDFKIYAEGYSDDFDILLEPYEFNITVSE